MKAKSMLFRHVQFLLLTASFTLLTQTINAEENGTDVNDTITVTANLFKDSYIIGEQVPIEIAFTNHGQEPAYIKVDEFGFLRTNVIVEDVNGSRIYPLGVPSPPAPPRYWWITVDGKKIYTEPVVKMEAGQTTKLAIRDALDLYHDQLQTGKYYLTPREQEVIHEVDSIIVREDQEHKLWIQPSAIISRARYQTNKVEITLHQRKIIYVDDDAVGNNDGTNWENAYTFLQDALADAKSAIKRVEIRVAQGVYKPKLETGYRISGTNITTSYLSRFQLINGVTLLGGYAGLTGPDPDIRDVENYETILSGDLNGDDIDVNNPSDLLDESTRSDNCSSIVIGSGTNRNAVLDGFIITGGRVRRHPAIIDSPTGRAGGMKNESGSPTINNCTFIGNSAESCGGGMLNDDGSNPILTNCKFINNYARRGGGVDSGNSYPTFINCTFTNNYADDGAGMSVYYSETTQAIPIELIDCTFEDNNAKNSGGGLVIYSGETVLRNCVFIGNSASKGGGLYNNSDDLNSTNCQFIGNYAQEEGGGVAGSYSTLTNCIFIDNSSNGYGGGLSGNNSIYNCIISGNTAVHNGGAIYGWGEVINCTIIGNRAGGNGGGICTQSITTLVNSIVRSNNALIGDEIYLGLRILPAGRGGTTEGTPSVMTISYSNVFGGEEEVSLDTDCTLVWESGNIDAEPYFADPGYWDPNGTLDDTNDDFWIEGDYHLKSQAGRWDPANEIWVVDDVTSPCIDAGDPNMPVGDEPMPNGSRINMGAYGGSPEASKSITTVNSRF